MAAVGSITITDPNQSSHPPREVRRVALAWTSDTSGNVSGILTNYLNGALVRVVFVPGTGGDAPAASYDVTLLNEDGIDLLAGQGANLSATVSSHVAPGLPLKDGTTVSVVFPQVAGKLELQVSGAGSLNKGTVVLYVM
jgi:hypothetical protein